MCGFEDLKIKLSFEDTMLTNKGKAFSNIQILKLKN
jgi:hypothetical protein